MHSRTRQALVALGAAGLIVTLSTTGSTALASDRAIEESAPVSASASAAVRPEVPSQYAPSQYAQAAFDAWIAGDGASLVDLAAPEVVQLLAARSADGDMWARSPRVCQAATGSTYCTRYSGDVQLTLRVANQAALVGAAHATTSAAFTRRPGAVAIWPMTTTEEAWKTQAKVDAGHSQWMPDSKAVVSAYASAELGFTQPVVESTAPTYFSLRVVDAATGVAADIEVNQPARAARDGIWAIARVNSLPAEAAAIPL